LEDGSLAEFHVHDVPLTTLTLEALKDVDVSKREAERSKNMFALGLMSWLYHRPTDETIAFLERKFKAKPEIAEANVKAFKAGWAYGETSEDFVVSYEVAPAQMAPGALHRYADEARASGPVDGHVRPQRRVAGAGGRGVDSGRLLRGGDRGCADRFEVPDARVPALRRLPGERFRAVAPAGRRLIA